MEANTPITPNTAKCGGCSARSKPDGAILSLCGNCKKQSSYGLACQRSHWSSHKVVCHAIVQTSSRSNSSGVKPPRTTAQHAGGERGDTKGPTYQKGSTFFTDSVKGAFNMLCGPGVWITPSATFSIPGICGLTVATQADVKARSLQHPAPELKVTRMVGFPLRLLGSRGAYSKLPNFYTVSLGTDPDIDSPSFGRPCWTTPPIGATIVTRTDGK